MTRRPPKPRISAISVEHVLQNWPRGARAVTDDLIHRYGLPHEATQTMLVWHYSGPWKRMVAHRYGALHRFPFHHRDYLEQTVDLRVPLRAWGELAEFNGSVMVDRTRGEVTSRCANEPTNFLLINLAHNIALGKMSVDEARSTCASAMAALRVGWPIAYANGLSFTPDVALRETADGTSDPDEPARALSVWR